MDNKKPRAPALAHDRFAAVRSEFAGLSLAERFIRIHETNLWGAETSISGLGSELSATTALRAQLPSLLAELGVRSLLDAPCGDSAWVDPIADQFDYTGVDIVPSLIGLLTARYPRRRYFLRDLTRDDLPHADAILCRDCLVHLPYALIGAAIARFKASGAAWLLTTSFTDLEANEDCEAGDWRPLNMAVAPFGWPAPLAVIVEGCEEAKGAYRDKSLAVWRLDALP